jgi:hypothetical protein
MHGGWPTATTRATRRCAAALRAIVGAIECHSNALPVFWYSETGILVCNTKRKQECSFSNAKARIPTTPSFVIASSPFALVLFVVLVIVATIIILAAAIAILAATTTRSARPVMYDELQR